jgi:hypothetical protein
VPCDSWSRASLLENEPKIISPDNYRKTGNKARAIETALAIGPLDLRWTLSSLAEKNLLTWMAKVEGCMPLPLSVINDPEQWRQRAEEARQGASR